MLLTACGGPMFFAPGGSLDGNLYIGPAEVRRWCDHIQAAPFVKVGFDGKVYPLKGVLVARPGELEGFAEDRLSFIILGRAF